MRRTKRNLAVFYVIVAVVGSIAAALAAVAMFFSGTFLPVYVAGEYVLKNQLVRYLLYAGLGVCFFYSQKLLEYGYSYLERKSMKRKIGRW